MKAIQIGPVRLSVSNPLTVAARHRRGVFMTWIDFGRPYAFSVGLCYPGYLMVSDNRKAVSRHWSFGWKRLAA